MIEKDKINELISTGTEIAGACVGGAIGFLAGGPVGAAGAGALGVVIAKGSEKLLIDIANRTLSKREEVRVGATAAYSLDKVKEYIEDGKLPRNDGFFEEGKNNRSNAEEVFEGVLLKAKNEHEEKKMKILANIFANVSFLPGFTIGEANHLLQIASNLTYRKMCTLSLIEKKECIGDLNLRQVDYRQFNGSLYYETMSILQEIFEMYNSGVIACKNENGQGYNAMLGWADVAPDRLVLTELGRRYYNVMGLNDIPEEDIRVVALYLS